MKNHLVAACGLVAFAGSAMAQGPATAELKNPQGAAIGTVVATATPDGVLIKVEVKGLPPGWHGMHLHAKGSCDDPKFESAGAHTHDGAASKHGLMNPDRTDTGDLPNIHAGADGAAMAEVFTTMVRLDKAEGNAAPLLDQDGSSLLIHANPDDYTSQPIGGAGTRIACAVIR